VVVRSNWWPSAAMMAADGPVSRTVRVLRSVRTHWLAGPDPTVKILDRLI
jgi:hypothetical protein